MNRQEVLARLDEIEVAIGRATGDGNEPDEGALSTLAELLRKMGQGQFRAQHDTNAALDALKEVANEQRRHNQHLMQRMEADRLRVVEWMDAMDDVMALARRDGDPKLIRWFERLEKRGLETLGAMGVSEVPGEGPFDEAVHEALESIRDAAVPAHNIVERVRRGYWADGKLLRRAAVIVSQGDKQ